MLIIIGPNRIYIRYLNLNIRLAGFDDRIDPITEHVYLRVRAGDKFGRMHD